MTTSRSTPWPRLSPRRAIARFEHVRSMAPTALRSSVDRLDSGASEGLGAAEDRSAERITRVRDQLRAIADEVGWPATLDSDAAAGLDRAWGRVLHEEMGISAREAADPSVWAHLSLLVVPDLCTWRFPDGPLERFLGLDQHVLGRLWWRSYVLGPDLVEGAGHQPLSERELRRLFRRRALVANPAVARAITRGVLGTRVPLWVRESLLRAVTLRMLRLMPSVCFDALTDEELDELVGEMLAPPG